MTADLLTRPLDHALGAVARRLGVLSMACVDRAFNTARSELREVGLLDDGTYLDAIDCERAVLPSLGGELGYVFDNNVPWHAALVGFRPGVIYLPLNPDVHAYVPGGTLVDTIRHEFAHAWAWLDRPFLERPWFARTFGAGYGEVWDDAPAFDRNEFVSEYATTSPAEDFAETFMTFLRCRRSVARWEARVGVHAKLKAVERAVSTAARTRAPRARPPRRRA